MSKEIYNLGVLIVALAQRMKASGAKPDTLSLIPGTHMFEEENDSFRLSSDLHWCTKAYMLVCVWWSE